MTMTTPTDWNAPDPEGGPAPGVEFASPGARLVGYIIDVAIVFGISMVLVLITIVTAAILPVLAILPILGFPII